MIGLFFFFFKKKKSHSFRFTSPGQRAVAVLFSPLEKELDGIFFAKTS